MKEIKKIETLAASALRKSEELKKIEKELREELTKSQAGDAIKDALIERLMQGVKDSETEKPIIGLDTLKKRPGNYITLGNGLQINADAMI